MSSTISTKSDEQRGDNHRGNPFVKIHDPVAWDNMMNEATGLTKEQRDKQFNEMYARQEKKGSKPLWEQELERGASLRKKIEEENLGVEAFHAIQNITPSQKRKQQELKKRISSRKKSRRIIK